ncbi:hypothetical protein, partial [Duodenibacillus massiliensis]|uniref:hypothetical protein n=1 Tax=Duodenibacillus massiliensis TaxID=1852381 RepID=UPI003AF811EC
RRLSDSLNALRPNNLGTPQRCEAPKTLLSGLSGDAEQGCTPYAFPKPATLFEKGRGTDVPESDR